MSRAQARIVMVNAIGYCRRSRESTARTVSLAEQAERIRAYCAAQGWPLVELVTDDGVSGGKRARLVRLEARVKAHQAGAVVVHNLDRFARDVAGMLDALHAYARRRVGLYVVGRGLIETTSANGKLITTIEGAMAEHFRMLIGEKTRDALAYLRRAGQRYSHVAPYGYRPAADGRHLALDHVEQDALATMRTLKPGRSYPVLSAELARLELRQRNGKPWSAVLLRRVLTREPIPIDLSVSAGSLSRTDVAA